MSAPLTARIAEEHVLASRALAPPPALAARRRAALAALAAQGLPTSRDENWKYANLRPLERLKFAPAPGQRALAAADLPAAIPGFARYVFVDGAFAPALSAPLDATTARVAPLAAAADASRTAAVPSPRPASADERFALLNEAFATDGVEIRLEGPSAAVARLELVFVARAESEEGASYPRVELRLESGTQLTLIERHVSAGGARHRLAPVAARTARRSGSGNRPAPAARDPHRRGALQPRRDRRQARRQHAVLPALARPPARGRAAAAEMGIPRGRGRADRRPRAAARHREAPGAAGARARAAHGGRLMPANLSPVASPALDVERVRRDFPILDTVVNGHPLVYLDSAASAQRPRAVLRAVEEYETHSHANVHRGVHALSQAATAAYEGARERVRRFINARSTREIIFVRG